MKMSDLIKDFFLLGLLCRSVSYRWASCSLFLFFFGLGRREADLFRCSASLDWLFIFILIIVIIHARLVVDFEREAVEQLG